MSSVLLLLNISWVLSKHHHLLEMMMWMEMVFVWSVCREGSNTIYSTSRLSFVWHERRLSNNNNKNCSIWRCISRMKVENEQCTLISLDFIIERSCQHSWHPIVKSIIKWYTVLQYKMNRKIFCTEMVIVELKIELKKGLTGGQVCWRFFSGLALIRQV